MQFCCFFRVKKYRQEEEQAPPLPMDGSEALAKRFMKPKYRAVGEGLAPPLAGTLLHKNKELHRNHAVLLDFPANLSSPSGSLLIFHTTAKKYCATVCGVCFMPWLTHQRTVSTNVAVTWLTQKSSGSCAGLQSPSCACSLWINARKPSLK